MDNRLTEAVSRADSAARAAQTMADLLAEINARTFGLEGRMKTFEDVDEVRTAGRKELLETIVANQQKSERVQTERQAKIEDRQTKTEIRLFGLIGAVTALKWAVEFFHK